MKISSFFIILLFVLNKSAKPESFSEINDCLNELIYRYFRLKPLRVYLADDFCFTGKAGIGNLSVRTFECLDYKVLFSSVAGIENIRFFDFEERLQYENAVLIATNQNDGALKKIIRNLKINSFWNTKLLAVLFKETENRPTLENLLLQLWKEARIWKAAVMAVPNFNGPFFLYGRHPYKKNSCEKTIDSIVMDKWEKGKFFFGRDPFPNRIAKGLNGCTVTASTTQTNPYVLRRKNPLDFHKGFDVRILNAAAIQYDFRVRFAFPPEGENHWTSRDESGNYIGTMGLLRRNEADLGFSGLKLEKDFYRDFGISKIYLRDSIVWCVPRPSKIKAWKKIVVVFSVRLWLSVGLVFLTTVSVFCFLSTKRTDPIHSISPMIRFMDVLRLSLGSCVPRPPTGLPSRCLFLSFVLYSLNIGTCYQSSLVSILTRVSYEEPIESAREALEKGLSLTVFPMEMRLYREEFSEKEMQGWPDKFRLTRRLQDTMDEVAYNRTTAFALSQIRAKFAVNQKYLDDQGVPLVRFTSKVAASELLVFYFSPNHPLKFHFDNVIIRLQESGILNLWLRDFFKRADVKEKEKPRHRPLSFVHLEGAFMLLVALLAFSCLVFSCEIMFFHLFRT